MREHWKNYPTKFSINPTLQYSSIKNKSLEKWSNGVVENWRYSRTKSSINPKLQYSRLKINGAKPHSTTPSLQNFSCKTRIVYPLSSPYKPELDSNTNPTGEQGIYPNNSRLANHHRIEVLEDTRLDDQVFGMV